MRSCRLDAVPDDLAARFWTKVQRGPGCWEWTASRSPRGYGRIGYGRRSQGIVLAPRVSFVLHHRPLQEGELVLHHCDNPPCVRPDHLYAGSDADNVRDMAARGRAIPLPPQPGEQHPNHKLTAKQVAEIRSRLASGCETHARIASDYSVGRTTVTAINRKQNWTSE